MLRVRLLSGLLKQALNCPFQSSRVLALWTERLALQSFGSCQDKLSITEIVVASNCCEDPPCLKEAGTQWRGPNDQGDI